MEAFEKDKEAIWLKENCARFGFILRFPKDKTDITGINFEPWHFRYVGEEHAQAMSRFSGGINTFLELTTCSPMAISPWVGLSNPAIIRSMVVLTDITGINFEPWHFRYVGEEHAQAIMEQGICLEEYLGETD